MNITNKNIYPTTKFSEVAEVNLIKNILGMPELRSEWLQRRLCTYPIAIEAEKDILIKEIMGCLWKVKSSSKLFKVFQDFDKVFTILEEKGHFIHSFEVFLLGLNIINALPLDKRNIVFKSHKDINKDLFFAWLLTSTAHDFGYPLQAAKKLTGKFAELYTNLFMNNIGAKFEELASQSISLSQSELLSVEAINFHDDEMEIIKIDDFILDGIMLSINGNKKDSLSILELLKKENNHGYISSLILCKTYINYLSETRKWQHKEELWRINMLKYAAAAISLHALPKENPEFIEMISCNLNPLAYMLFLVDNLQDWHRSLRPHNEYPIYSLNNFDTTSSNSIILEYNLYHEDWSDSRLEETKKYIKGQANLIDQAKKPNPKANINIIVKFYSNFGHELPTININL